MMLIATAAFAQTEKRPDLDRKFIELYNKAEFTEAWKLVKQGADPDAPLMPGGLTPLEHAGMNGMVKHIAFLSSVDAKSVDSALIVAVSRHVGGGGSPSRADIADRLIKIGANPQAVDKYGRSVLYWATKARDDEIVQRLVVRGGVPDLYSQLMICPATELPVAAKRFLGTMEALCQCPSGATPRMTNQGGRFTRWCQTAAEGRKVGLEVEGRLDAQSPPGLWGDWHPREIVAARLHGPAGVVELYSCTNLSCMKLTR